MLKLHGDISHKKTCVCILINDQMYCETVPNKSNALSGVAGQNVSRDRMHRSYALTWGESEAD